MFFQFFSSRFSYSSLVSCVCLVPLWAVAVSGGVPCFSSILFSPPGFSPPVPIYITTAMFTLHMHLNVTSFITCVHTLSPMLASSHKLIVSFIRVHQCYTLTHIHTSVKFSDTFSHSLQLSPARVCLCAPCASMAQRFRHALAASKPPPPAHPGTVSRSVSCSISCAVTSRHTHTTRNQHALQPPPLDPSAIKSAVIFCIFFFRFFKIRYLWHMLL